MKPTRRRLINPDARTCTRARAQRIRRRAVRGKRQYKVQMCGGVRCSVNKPPPSPTPGSYPHLHCWRRIHLPALRKRCVGSEVQALSAEGKDQCFDIINQLSPRILATFSDSVLVLGNKKIKKMRVWMFKTLKSSLYKGTLASLKVFSFKSPNREVLARN